VIEADVCRDSGHEAPPRVRQVRATPFPQHFGGGYDSCVRCGAPLHLSRDTAVWSGWKRDGDQWRIVTGHDEFPEWWTRDGFPPELDR